MRGAEPERLEDATLPALEKEEEATRQGAQMTSSSWEQAEHLAWFLQREARSADTVIVGLVTSR